MPARLRDIKRAVEALGCEVEKPDGDSHWHVHGPNGKKYSLASHRGLHQEVPDSYINKLCKALDLDRDRVWALIRG